MSDIDIVASPRLACVSDACRSGHRARTFRLALGIGDRLLGRARGDGDRATGRRAAATSASAESFAREHIAGAIHLHHSLITEDALSAWPDDTLFVVYCAGPHCNGADRGAANIARLGRKVKKMIGGMAGWLDEGFTFVGS